MKVGVTVYNFGGAKLSKEDEKGFEARFADISDRLKRAMEHSKMTRAILDRSLLMLDVTVQVIESLVYQTEDNR
jgi:hypothetical protein